MNPIYSKSTSYFDVGSSHQKSLEANNYFVRVGHVAHAALKSIGNIFSPLVSTQSRSLVGRVTDVGVNLLKAVGTILLLVLAIFAGLKGVAFFVSGSHDLHVAKYETALSQYGTKKGGHVERFRNDPNLHSSSVIGILLKQCTDLLRPSQNMDARERYQQYVKKLDEVALAIEARLESRSREPLASHEEACILAAEELALDRWSGVDMTKYYDDRINLATAGRQSTSSRRLQDTPRDIKATNDAIKEAHPSTKKSKIALMWQQFRGGPLGNKYYTGTENVPNRLAKIRHDNMEDEIVQMRHGSPTTGVKVDGNDTIAPNYELFIRAAKRQGKSVFYTIHQRLQKSKREDESPRTRAILALQKKHTNFFAMVQPLDGEFYRKQGKYENQITFSRLKTAIEFEFFDNKNNPSCALPPELRLDSSYRERFGEIFDEVHREFFDGKNYVPTKEEWQDFIHIFYAYQRIDLRARLPNVGYAVTACKDDLDRGGGQQLLEHTILLMMEEGQGASRNNSPNPRSGTPSSISSASAGGPASGSTDAPASGSTDGPDEGTSKKLDLEKHILGAPLNTKMKEVVGSRLRPILGTLERVVIPHASDIKKRGNDFFGEHGPSSVSY